MDLALMDKVVLVTGGSRGLGEAISLALAAEGAKVALNYRKGAEKAEAMAAKIAADHGVDACAIQADVSRESDVLDMFCGAEEKLGPIDVLINNAGVWPTAYVKNMTETDWSQTLAVNLTGPFLTSREATRRWLASGRTGTIVNVSSQAAFRGSTTGHAHYAASKAGLVSFTVSLAREVARQGVRVNAVAAGMMRTDMADEALRKNEHKYIQRIPLGRIADPAEIAGVVVFLASSRSSYITGATVDASGGMLMR